MTLLVIGASGHLGGELCRQVLSPAVGSAATRSDVVRSGVAGSGVAGSGVAGSEVVVVGTYGRAPGRVPGVRWERLDLRDRAAVAGLFDTVRPSTVVNCAYDYRDWMVNADGAAYVAFEAARRGSRLVHLSTDALHSGRTQPYLDDEPPSPVTAYGAGKAAAETAVRLVDPAAAIVRTSLIMGDEHSKQVRLCLDLITGAAPGALFSDEYRCPIDVSDLAGAVLELAGSDYAGLINVAGPDAVNRAELGYLVARWYGLDTASMPVRTLAEAGLVRPGEVRLDVSRAQSILSTRLRGVRELGPVGGAPQTSGRTEVIAQRPV